MYLGLDLGQVVDFTSLAAVERWKDRWSLTHLRTWKPVRPDCLDALDDTIAFVHRSCLEERPALAIDSRGIGREVAIAALEGATARTCDVFPILPSYSDRPHRQREDGQTWIGKRALVDGLLTALESRQLVIARDLPEAPALRQELLGLRQVSTRRGTAWTWSAGPGGHDDRAMATAYALWLARTLTEQGSVDAIRPARRSA